MLLLGLESIATASTIVMLGLVKAKKISFMLVMFSFEFQISIHKFGRSFVFLSCLCFYKERVLCLVTWKMEEKKMN